MPSAIAIAAAFGTRFHVGSILGCIAKTRRLTTPNVSIIWNIRSSTEEEINGTVK